MLELCKKVLSRVCFDRRLFAQELTKSVRYLKGEELKQLHRYCLKQFSRRYRELIDHTFLQVGIV
jgi:hypothetical protein